MKTAVRNNKVKKSKEDKIFDFILYGIAAILIVVALYPMYFIVIPIWFPTEKFYFCQKELTLKLMNSLPVILSFGQDIKTRFCM